MSKASRQHKPRGMRMSWGDAGVLLLAGAITAGLWPVIDEMALLFAVVPGHFFLFCNVFRVPRTHELVWSGVFLVNVSVWYVLGPLDWWAVLGTQAPITAGLILHAFLLNDYHGLFWRYAPRPRQVEPTTPTEGAPS